jgi:hypothetical protein
VHQSLDAPASKPLTLHGPYCTRSTPACQAEQSSAAQAYATRAQVWRLSLSLSMSVCLSVSRSLTHVCACAQVWVGCVGAYKGDARAQAPRQVLQIADAIAVVVRHNSTCRLIRGHRCQAKIT